MRTHPTSFVGIASPFKASLLLSFKAGLSFVLSTRDNSCGLELFGTCSASTADSLMTFYLLVSSSPVVLGPDLFRTTLKKP